MLRNFALACLFLFMAAPASSSSSSSASAPDRMHRELGLFGAVITGLGSIVGTGAFVSIALGTELLGSGVLWALIAAALLALCNGLSSAQLAAAHPVAGGTYEYAYHFLNPGLGRMAGWSFLIAKTASAATAALGCAGYLLVMLGLTSGEDPQRWLIVVTALAITALITLSVVSGMRRTKVVNGILVSLTVLTLLVFIGWANFFQDPLPADSALLKAASGDSGGHPLAAFLLATALLFVAYTGYGRIATLGEEVKEPRKTIPLAIFITLAVSCLLYIGVAVGLPDRPLAADLANAALFATLAKAGNAITLSTIFSLGAILAMAGVLLNLVLGLSRVWLAMARRTDIPRYFSQLTESHRTPRRAILLTAVTIALIALTGGIELAWTLSAFTVLIYYAVTNLTALRLPPENRIFPRFISVCGLIGCVALALAVPVVALS